MAFLLSLLGLYVSSSLLARFERAPHTRAARILGVRVIPMAADPERGWTRRERLRAAAVWGAYGLVSFGIAAGALNLTGRLPFLPPGTGIVATLWVAAVAGGMVLATTLYGCAHLVAALFARR